MKPAIVIAFTLKGQDFHKKILPVLEVIAKNNPDAFCIHGFMPKHVLEEKGLSMGVCDALYKLFPWQLNIYNNGVARHEMARITSLLNAQVYVIGDVIDGVKEEVEMYEILGLTITKLSII